MPGILAKLQEAYYKEWSFLMPDVYDWFDPRIFANPYPLYHRLRSRHPVYLDEDLSCWVVTSYEYVISALANRSLSSERTKQGALLRQPAWAGLAPLFTDISRLMFYADPPRHTRLRSLVQMAFTPRMIQKWRPRIQRIVDDQLDTAWEKKELDIIRDIAFPLPARVIAEMLSIPPHDYAQFKRWSDDLVAFLGNPPTLEQCTQLMQSIQSFRAYFHEIIEKHRQYPGDDLIDALLQSQDGDMLTEDELLMNCIGLFVGGHETTANLIGNGLFALLNHPEELQKLRENPSLIGSAVEELLRYDSPVQFMARVAKQPVEISGQTIYQGQSVMLMIGAANRDPQQFHEPDRLDITRKNNHHLAFGHNIHFCIGASLARLEAQITIDTILRRMLSLHLQAIPFEWQENLSFHGLKALPVSF